MQFILLILLQQWIDMLRETNVFNTSQVSKNYPYDINICKPFNCFCREFVIRDILRSGLAGSLFWRGILRFSLISGLNFQLLL